MSSNAQPQGTACSMQHDSMGHPSSIGPANRRTTASLPTHLGRPNEELIPLPRLSHIKQRPCVVLRLDARPVAAVLRHGQAGAQAQAFLLHAVAVHAGLQAQEGEAGGNFRQGH